ncbi:GDNF-inducible zinc finger protein 1-like isoform X2 [Polistes fuscatus]|uniref:GDNF-inducible zinc finger protein 1-like isoform X2 n=1 Tax=Polistes fuscatus TaxID=30207 RepID=UPI001CA97ECE|nr:GDNF-inducible zinc finger protein 1-like isoform X2 [Polistes fuscatus]
MIHDILTYIYMHRRKRSIQTTMSGEQFSLIWNSFPRNLSSGLYTSFIDEQLVDVTLTAEGQILRAHKLILSVCSSYFNRLFKENSCKHPIVILKDVNYRDLFAILQFMYQGEVSIKQEDISNFLKVAEILQIKGLTKERKEKKDKKLDDNNEKSDCYFEDIYQCNKLTESLSDKEVQKENTILPSSDSVIQNLDIMERNVTNEIPYSNNVISNTDCNSERALFIESSNDQTAKEPLDCKNVISNTDCNSESALFIESSNDQTANEPFDCTSNINHEEEMQYESSNYMADTDVKPMHKSDTPNNVFCNIENIEKSGSESDTQLKSADESLGITNTVIEEHNNLRYDAANCGKKHGYKREIRPIFHMEKGKLVQTYSCPKCLRNFTRRENLKLHVRFIHGPLESLTCKLCGNKYKNSNSLRVHSYLYHNSKRNKHNKSLVNDSI